MLGANRMSPPRLVQCLLWDFGDTLAEWTGNSPEWASVYNSIGWREKIGPAWSLGEIETSEVLGYLVEHLQMTESEVVAHLLREDLFEFAPFTHEFFVAMHLPQSVVTNNPPLFRQLVSPLGLNEVTDTIVISGEEGTVDKGVLCQKALQQMNLECTNDRVLLIDNKQSNLDAWADRGGIGYLYTTDAAFQSDVASGIDGLVF